jgi:hypothetical protein
MLKALRRDVLAILGRRQLRAWDQPQECSSPRLAAPGVVEGTATSHTDGGAGG